MRAVWYFDFISPFAYLQLPKMLALRERIAIEPRPILFAAVLQHHGLIGPAEIPQKRIFTYRFVRWVAEQEGTPLHFPPTHPFNPLAALRLCIAAGNRWDAVDAIFKHLWHLGRAGDRAEALIDIGARIGIADVTRAIDAPAVKAALRANTEQALAAGVFGVPTLAIDDTLFWGNDATEMALQFIADPDLFGDPEYARVDALPVGIERTR